MYYRKLSTIFIFIIFCEYSAYIQASYPCHEIPIVTEWTCVTYRPQTIRHCIDVYASANLNFFIESPEMEGHATLGIIGRKITTTFLQKNLTIDSLRTFASLWEPIEIITELYAPDVILACAFIMYNKAFCVTRGACELHVHDAQGYIAPATMDILNRHAYESDPLKERPVPLFGCADWLPGKALFAYSHTIESHICSEAVHAFIQKNPRKTTAYVASEMMLHALLEKGPNDELRLKRKSAAIFMLRNKKITI